MANNVSFYATINGSFEVDDKLREMFDVAKEETNNAWASWSAESLPIYDTPQTDEGWYAWGCENMGAKWVCIEDVDGASFSGHSAWSPPIALVINLVKTLVELSGEDISATINYEDEFRNFIGVDHISSQDGHIDHDENFVDGDELTDLVEEAFGMSVDSDEFDWWDETMKTKAGNTWSPQEYIDEVVSDFWHSGKISDLGEIHGTV